MAIESGVGWRRAICNELFGAMGFEQSCDLLAAHGFHGVEIAPFTLADQDGRLAPQTIARVRRALAGSGISFAGFHWLLAHPAGLHATCADAAVRSATWTHVRRLLEAAGELGGGPLVFGSPRQRSAVDVPVEQARLHLQQGMLSVCAAAHENNSLLLMEALPLRESNVVNTLADAQQLIETVNCPAVRGMFDFHNCADESLRWAELIERYAAVIRHVHLNTRSGSYPRRLTAEYRNAFARLQRIGYNRWVSLEIFHQPQDAAQVLRDTRQFLDRVEAQCREGDFPGKGDEHIGL